MTLSLILAQTATAAGRAASTAPVAPAPEEPWGWGTWGTIIMGILVVALIFTWGAVRFWIVSTRPPAIKDVHTPTLDRLNAKALEHMSDGVEDEEDQEPPQDLLAVVPEEEPKDEGTKEKA